MAVRDTPGIGLKSDWELGEDTWKPGMDANLLKLSMLVHLTIESFQTSVPGSSANGLAFAITAGANAGTIAVRDQGAWVLYPIRIGWRAFNKADGLMYNYTATGWQRADKDQAAVDTRITGIEADSKSRDAGILDALFRAVPRDVALESTMAGLNGFHWALRDESGNVLAGLDVDLNWRGRNPDLSGTDLLSPYLWAAVTEDGSVVFAVLPNGEFVTGVGLASPGTAFYTLVEGGVGVPYVVKNGTPRRIFYRPFSAAMISVSGDFAKIGSATSVEDIEIAARHNFLPSVTSIYVIVGYGQSLSTGTASTPPLSTVALDPGRAEQWAAGPRLGNDAGTPDSSFYSMRDLFETSVETPMSHMAHQHIVGAPASRGVVAWSAGVGGRSYSQLKKGTEIYNSVLKGIRRAKVMANLNGWNFEAPLVTFTQGENNRTNAEADYKASLVELQADLTLDCANLFSVPTQVQLFVDQISNWTAYNIPSSEVPLAQLNAALENPGKIICIGPKYMLQSVSDGVHLTNTASALLGDYQGGVQALVRSGTPFTPMHVSNAQLQGANLVLDFNVPEGDLVLDTTLVSNPGNYGVTIFSGAPTISSVTKTGPRQLTVALNAAPSAPFAVGIALQPLTGAAQGPNTGPRSCIRDECTRLAADGTTRLYNWACHQKLTINP